MLSDTLRGHKHMTSSWLCKQPPWSPGYLYIHQLLFLKPATLITCSCVTVQNKITHNHRRIRCVYVHLPNWLRHRAFLLLVIWMTSRTSPWITDRSFPPGLFMTLLGSTIMVCSTLSGPSYWETRVTFEFLII